MNYAKNFQDILSIEHLWTTAFGIFPFFRTPLSSCSWIMISSEIRHESFIMRSNQQGCSIKKVFLKFRKIRRKTPVPEFLILWSCRPESCNFIKKETLAQAFSSEFCEIFKSTLLQNISGRLLLYYSISYSRSSFFQCSEAVVYMCSINKVFRNMLRNSHENTCARISFLIKLLPHRLQLY